MKYVLVKVVVDKLDAYLCIIKKIVLCHIIQASKTNLNILLL